jgi:hypothetical protein
MTYQNVELDVPLMFTPEQVATILSVSRSQVFALLRADELDSVAIGRSRRITQSQLIEYITRKENESHNGDVS